MKNEQLLREAFRLRTLAGLQPIGEVFGDNTDKSLEEDNDTLTKGIHKATKSPSNVMELAGEKCSCGGSYEMHDDAGEYVCADCGERQPMAEDKDEFDDMEGEHEMELGADQAIKSQYDLQEDQPSLRQQVQEFVKKAIEGGSTMDEAKKQAREYFKKAPGSLNEAVKLTPDHVNPYELRKGIEMEMGYAQKAAPSWQEASLMNIADGYAKAQAKALKNLAKDPAYYSNKIANKKEEKKVKVKGDGYIMAPKSLREKSNVTNKKQKPTKVAGVKTMPDKGVTGSEKVVKEGIHDHPSMGKVTDNPQTNVKGSTGSYDPKARAANLAKLAKFGPKSKEDKTAKIKEYVKAQLKKEAQLVKSATTGATIDIVPDAQATQVKTDLQKKGVKTTSTKV